MNKKSIEIKGLIKDEVCMGTYGLVELKLLELEKEVEMLKLENIALQDAKMNSMLQASEKASNCSLDVVSKLLLNDTQIQSIAEEEILYNEHKRAWFMDGMKYMRDYIKSNIC